MTRDDTIKHIRSMLNDITNKRYTRRDQAFAYQLGFLLGFVAEEMMRDSYVYSRFRERVRRSTNRPRC